MPRANRHYIPGQVWHITHRCHKKEFLLRFRRDRQRWHHWLFEAKKRYGLQVLNFMITSNHIHLLVIDGGDREALPRSLQLVASRTGQEYNQRNRSPGRSPKYQNRRTVTVQQCRRFGQADRRSVPHVRKLGRSSEDVVLLNGYQPAEESQGGILGRPLYATAIEGGEHFVRCMAYIDLNMLRAGVVDHPSEWPDCGYHEIRNPRQRYAIIDRHKLAELAMLGDFNSLKESHAGWLQEKLPTHGKGREDQWSTSIAVGGEYFFSALGPQHSAVTPRDTSNREKDRQWKRRQRTSGTVRALQWRFDAWK